jgi:hypothetical protein
MKKFCSAESLSQTIVACWWFNIQYTDFETYENKNQDKYDTRKDISFFNCLRSLFSDFFWLGHREVEQQTFSWHSSLAENVMNRWSGEIEIFEQLSPAQLGGLCGPTCLWVAWCLQLEKTFPMPRALLIGELTTIIAARFPIYDKGPQFLQPGGRVKHTEWSIPIWGFASARQTRARQTATPFAAAELKVLCSPRKHPRGASIA